MTVHGGSLAVAQLMREGIDVLFSLNGGHVAPIFDASLDLGLPIVDVRHEDAAVHMAHAYARVKRRVAVACVTAGPGLTNATSGMATAAVNLAPVVLIGGKVPIPQLDLGALQDIDQVGIMRPITKSSRTVHSVERIPWYLSDAVRLASRPPHGPCFVEIPTDVLRAQMVGNDPSSLTVPTAPGRLPKAGPEDVDRVADILSRSTRPVIVAGSGVWWSGASASLRRLVEVMGVPLLTTSLARGVLPKDHDLNLYAARSRLLSQADVVLILGTRFNYVLNYGRPPRVPGGATVVHVDASVEELDRNRVADLAIQCDLDSFLTSLEHVVVAPEVDAGWLQQARLVHSAAVDSTRAEIASDAAPIHPLRLCAEIVESTPENTRFVADGGDILSYARQTVHPTGPGRFLDPGPFGCLGVGIPYSNAVKLAFPADPVVCFIGDGALGFNIMELDTAVRHGLSVVIVVSNNASWGIERNSQIEDFGPDRVVGTELADLRFDHVARALGCHSERVTEPGDLGAALQRALESDRPALIDVVTDQNARSPDLLRGLARVPDRTPLDWVGSGKVDD